MDRSGKVRWSANELGYQIEEQRIKSGEHNSGTYRQMNPYEQIPIAEVAGKILVESTAICMILAERHPEAGLLPLAGRLETYLRRLMARPAAQASRFFDSLEP